MIIAGSQCILQTSEKLQENMRYFAHNGRKKGRLVAIGFKEPKHWDIKSNSSPVVSINTIRALLFKAGLCADVYSSIDISVAFLQSNPYDDDAPKRYVVRSGEKETTRLPGA